MNKCKCYTVLTHPPCWAIQLVRRLLTNPVIADSMTLVILGQFFFKTSPIVTAAFRICFSEATSARSATHILHRLSTLSENAFTTWRIHRVCMSVPCTWTLNGKNDTCNVLRKLSSKECCQSVSNRKYCWTSFIFSRKWNKTSGYSSLKLWYIQKPDKVINCLSHRSQDVFDLKGVSPDQLQHSAHSWLGVEWISHHNHHQVPSV